MSKTTYPKRFLYESIGLVVEFTSLTVGTVIRCDGNEYDVGFENSWTKHTDKIWIPIESKKQYLMAKIKNFI